MKIILKFYDIRNQIKNIFVNVSYSSHELLIKSYIFFTIEQTFLKINVSVFIVENTVLQDSIQEK